MTPARTPSVFSHHPDYYPRRNEMTDDYTLRMRDEDGNLRETNGLSAEQVMEMANGQQVAFFATEDDPAGVDEVGPVVRESVIRHPNEDDEGKDQ
jgi:hypothetical protein